MILIIDLEDKIRILTFIIELKLEQCLRFATELPVSLLRCYQTEIQKQSSYFGQI